MKTILADHRHRFTALLLAVAVFVPASCPAASPVTALVKRALSAASHLLDDAGKPAARSVEKGGPALSKAAAKHGPEVRRLSRLCPEAPKALATDAGRILPVARRFGDDAARIEMKVPGAGDVLGRCLPPESLSTVARRGSGSDIKRFAILSRRLPKSEMLKVVKAWERNGSKVFEAFTPGRIVAVGAGGALIIAAENLTGGKSPLPLPPKPDKPILPPDLPERLAVFSYCATAALLLLMLRRPLLRLLRRAIRAIFRRLPGAGRRRAGNTG